MKKDPPSEGKDRPAVRGSTVGELYLQRRQRLLKLVAEAEKPETVEPEVKPQSVPVARVEPQSVPDIDEIQREMDESRRHRDQIIKIARQNMEWYLEQQRLDGNRKPWFHYLRHDFQYAEFVLVTPAMAEELKKWNDPENRIIKLDLLAAYRRDQEQDNWIPSQEGLAINLKGIMFDGQHRNQAIIDSGRPLPIWITFQVLNEAKFTTDSGAKRSVNEKLRMVCDASLGNRTAGFVKALMRGTGAKSRFSESEIAKFASKFEPVITWVRENLPGVRADVQAAVAKAYLWWGEKAVADFCRRLRGQVLGEDGDPVKSLYNFLQKMRIKKSNDPIQVYKKTLQALEYERTKKSMDKLYEKDEDIFEWVVDDQKNYSLPERPAQES